MFGILVAVAAGIFFYPVFCILDFGDLNMVRCYNDFTEGELRRVIPLMLQLRNPLPAAPNDGGGDNSDADTLRLRILDELVEICGVGSYAELAWLWNSKPTVRPFERVKAGGKWCYLPAENYADTTGIEIALANMYYLRFATSGGTDNKALGNLLAVVCRPRPGFLISLKRFSTTLELTRKDKREGFDSMRCESRAAGFLELPIWELYSILQYWEGMNEQFLKIYATVFEGDNGEKPLFENGEGWIAVLEDIARDGVHGDFERVCGTNAHTLFMYLKHCKIKAQQK